MRSEGGDIVGYKADWRETSSHHAMGLSIKKILQALSPPDYGSARVPLCHENGSLISPWAALAPALASGLPPGLGWAAMYIMS